MPITARGPLSQWVVDRLAGGSVTGSPAPRTEDPFSDDLHLALYLCYEPHFGPLPGGVGVDEWDPEVIRFRRTLETTFVLGLREAIGTHLDSRDLRESIPSIIDADEGPSLSTYIEHHGTLAQMREAALHRSPYQLKEGDAHTLGIPHLRGRAKQLLVEIQSGEYGADGVDREMHSTLFARTMRTLGLDDTPNAYLDVLPASAFMVSNLVSMFGLDRRWRGALVGHLAVFEMTSVVPMGRYSRGLERVGAPAEARRFYDVHVLADAEHERLALDLACEFAAAEPDLVDDVLFGARAVLAVEERFAGALLDSWAQPPSAVTHLAA